MRSFVVWGLLPGVLACSFDATGVDSSPPAAVTTTTGGAETSTTSATTGPGTTTGEPTTGASGGATTGEPELTSEPLTTGPAATEPGTTGSSTTDDSTTSTSTSTSTTDATTSTSTTDDSTTTGASETTGPPPCDQLFLKEILLVENATVEAPMQKVMNGKGEGMVANSQEAEKGTVTFAIDLPCDGPIAIWGRVQDTNPGLANPDPDSYYVRTDGDPESAWFYGCQTGDLESGYHWLRVTSATQLTCDAPEWTPNLAAGAHTIRLRNREAVANMAVAAVARLLITNDMDYVPTLPD